MFLVKEFHDLNNICSFDEKNRNKEGQKKKALSTMKTVPARSIASFIKSKIYIYIHYHPTESNTQETCQASCSHLCQALIKPLNVELAVSWTCTCLGYTTTRRGDIL